MENYKNESMVDVAYSVLKEGNKQYSFKELFEEVAAKLEFSDEEKLNRISKFYTNLSLDGRFVTVGNNEWDLRENQTYDKVHIDMNDVYSDLDESYESNQETEDLEEEKAANGDESDDDDVSGVNDDFESNKED